MKRTVGQEKLPERNVKAVRTNRRCWKRSEPELPEDHLRETPIRSGDSVSVILQEVISRFSLF